MAKGKTIETELSKNCQCEVCKYLEQRIHDKLDALIEDDYFLDIQELRQLATGKIDRDVCCPFCGYKGSMDDLH